MLSSTGLFHILNHFVQSKAKKFYLCMRGRRRGEALGKGNPVEDEELKELSDIVAKSFSLEDCVQVELY